MGESQEPPREWKAAVKKVVEGTDLLARVQCSESWEFMGNADTADIHRVKTHHFGGNGVDGDAVGRGEHVVFDYRDHGPRSGAVAGYRTIDNGKYAAVNFFLNSK